MNDGANHRTPPVHLLKCLLVVMRVGTFTAAARELGLNQSSVSRQMRDLEHMLDTVLFRRIGRRIVPTDAARRLARALDDNLRRLDATIERFVSAGSDVQILRLACLPTFADRWLLPRLPAFERRYPGVRVDVATRSAPFDFRETSFDVAIHYGLENWPDGTVQHLCAERMAPVAAPTLAGVDPADQTLPRLHLLSRPDAWTDWAIAAGRPTAGLQAGRRLDQFSLIVTAALQGFGIALLPLYLIERELAQGQLVALSETSLETEAAYHVVLPSGLHNPIAGNFARWIRGAVGRPIDAVSA